MREDHTNDVEGAAGWARAHGGDGDYGDAPSRAEAEADAYYDGPTNVTVGGIRCAHCKNRHATKDDVRWCADLEAEARAEQAHTAAAERAFAEEREAIAERGTWFGPTTAMDEDPAEATDPIFNREPVELNRFGNPMHETPCVCGVYDRCSGVRAEDAASSGNWRDRFRAYND